MFVLFCFVCHYRGCSCVDFQRTTSYFLWGWRGDGQRGGLGVSKGRGNRGSKGVEVGGLIRVFGIFFLGSSSIELQDSR